jgi:hypothetical protein
MLININAEQKFHSWMASKIIDGGAYNGEIKTLTGNFIGKYSMAMSTTFPNHNKMLYYNKMSNSSQVGAIAQELGRVNGQKTPVIITTKKVQNAVLNYLKFNDNIIDQEIYKKTAFERQGWFSSYLHEDPHIIPGRKHRKNRVISSFEVETPGSEDTCNEHYTRIYLPDLYKKEWKGKGIGVEIRDAIKGSDPMLYDHIKDMTYLTDTDTRTDGDIWHKQREGTAQVRFGKDWANPGYVAIVIRKSMETGFESFYEQTGYLKTNKTRNEGFIYTVLQHEQLNKMVAKASAELRLLN